MGEKVVLLNYFLSNIPIFFCSFYKAQKEIIKEIIMLQRVFLWGGAEDRNIIFWISWSKVCFQKEEGGLGVKYSGRFSLALLNKWKWIILNDQPCVLADFLSCMHDNIKLSMLDPFLVNANKKYSFWWKEMCSLGVPLEENQAMWLSSSITCNLGNGNNIDFWRQDLLPCIISQALADPKF